MKTMIKQYACVACGILALSLSSSAANVSSSPMLYVTNQLAVNPSNAVEYATLKEQEAGLLSRQHEIEQKIFKVMLASRDRRKTVMGDDKELAAMVREIAEKQAAFARRMAEKYPDVGNQDRERDELTRQHSELGKQLGEVRAKIDVLESRMPAKQ